MSESDDKFVKVFELALLYFDAKDMMYQRERELKKAMSEASVKYKEEEQPK